MIIFDKYTVNDDVVYDRVSTTDIAVTLSAVLGIKAPSGAQGKILEKVLDSD